MYTPPQIHIYTTMSRIHTKKWSYTGGTQTVNYDSIITKI